MIQSVSNAVSLTRRWLARPVIEEFGIDRPFRLRRVSLLLLIGGWTTFLASVLAGLWLTHHHVSLATYGQLWSADLSAADRPLLQWARRLSEALGAASFFAGLGSVSLFDRRDCIGVWRAD